MSLQEHTATLGIGETRRIPIIAGELQFFSVIGSFRFGFKPGEMVTGREGDTLEGITDGVYVTNTDAGATTLSIRYGTGIRFGQSDNVTISGTANVAVADWNDPDAILAPTDVVAAASGAQLVSASRATKLHTIISNPSGSGVTVRIGPAGVAANKGASLRPGGDAIIPGSQAVYVYNTHATDAVSIQVTELDKE